MRELIGHYLVAAGPRTRSGARRDTPPSTEDAERLAREKVIAATAAKPSRVTVILRPPTTPTLPRSAVPGTPATDVRHRRARKGKEKAASSPSSSPPAKKRREDDGF